MNREIDFSIFFGESHSEPPIFGSKQHACKNVALRSILIEQCGCWSGHVGKVMEHI
jgi:hypothetical protein